LKTTWTVALVAAALLAAPAALAQQAPQSGEPFLPSYLSLSAGGYVPERTYHQDDSSRKGFAGFITSGYMTSPFFGAQFDIGYFETSGHDNLKVSAVPLALSLKLAVPLSFVEPYVVGGAGVYFTRTRLDAGPSSVDSSSYEFAPHAGAGVNLNFGKFQIGAEGRYVWLRPSDVKVDGWLVLGKVGSRF
jgi:hypothetical protein